MKPANRRYLTGVSHARVIVGSDEAPPLRLWREKRGDAPEDLWKCRSPAGSNIETLFYANAAFFLRRLLIGHGVRAKRSKSGAISFDLATPESNYAAV